MKFEKQLIKNSYLIINNKKEDNRGFFFRSYCKKIFKKYLDKEIAQCNISFTKEKKTIRGIHYQKGKYAEDKIMHILSGKVFFVLIDLRKNSKTYLKKLEIILDSKLNHSFLLPKGCANGFMTLQKNTFVSYEMTEFFKPSSYYGIKYNDPYFKINWPYKPKIISKFDMSHPKFSIK